MKKELKAFLIGVLYLCGKLEQSFASDPKLAKDNFGVLPVEVQEALVVGQFFREKAEKLLEDEFTPPPRGLVN